MILTILPIEEYLFDPIKLGFLLVVLTFLGYVVFVKCYPLSDNAWKKSEVILLLCSVLGIGSLVGSNRKFFYEREQISIGCQIDTYKYRFNSVLDTAIYNRSFSTTLYSYEYIQKVENDYKTIYTWVLENNPIFIQSVCNKETIDCDSIIFPIVSDCDLLSDIKSWKELISDYNKLIENYQFYVYNKDENGFEFCYNILYPLFFVIGLSYCIVKYLGEYYNYKRSKRNENV